MPQLVRIGGLMGVRKGSAGGSANLPHTLDAAFTSGATSAYYSSVGPNAVYYADVDKTFVVWEAWSGFYRAIMCKYYFHDTANGGAAAAWSGDYFVAAATETDDDHGVPCIERNSNGRLVIVYGLHNGAQQISISTNANDITAWTAGTGISALLAYPHLDVIGSTMYAWFRESRTGGGDLGSMPLVLYKLTFSGTTVTSTRLGDTIVSWVGDRFYSGTHIVIGTKIYIFAARAPLDDSYRSNVYAFVYESTTDAISNLDASVTTASGSFPIDKTLSDASYRLVDQDGSSQRGAIPQVCLNSAGTRFNIGYKQGAAAVANGAYSYMHAAYNVATGAQTIAPHAVAVGAPSAAPDGTDASATHASDYFGLTPRADGGIDYYWTSDCGVAAIARGGNVSKTPLDSSGVVGAATLLQTVSNDPLGTLLGLYAGPAVRNALPELAVLFRQVAASSLDADATGLYCGWAYGSNGYRGYGTYGPDVGNYVARMSTVPAANVLQALLTLFDTMKASGSWSRKWQIWIPFAQNQASALVGVKSARAALTITGSPVFSAYGGFTAVSGGYVSPGQIGQRLGATSNFHIVMALKSNAAGVALAGTLAALNDLNLEYGNAGAAAFKVGDTTSGVNGVSVSLPSVVVAGNRSGTAEKLYENGVEIGSATATNSNFTAGTPMTFGRRTTTSSGATMYWIAVGATLTTAQLSSDAAAIKTFLNTITPGTIQ